ncbi:MAG: DNA mismatch repair endonuclease MutL [Rikenellaceae bacterium]|nr:DNA mismatch repair endonuclease MutL [Rikenellaceae bacterium]
MEENRIHLLPEIVANQIAAGEVVDNPSSAIKEMMENAIDAGATSVTVNFRNAGLELIQVVDNGCGMSPIDARMAFDRHATSKIRDFDDVYRLQTFGFRGEALASIAAVAQVELRTRKAEDEVGTVTIVNGGEFISQTPTMCPVGSQFMVRNLFYTAPARRKFASDKAKMVTEIKKVFRQVALCNPEIRCELMSNDMPIMTLPSGSLSERIVDVVGRHIKTNLLEVAVDTSLVKISGYVGRPAAAKQKNNEQYLFVNGRYFRSSQIYRAIMKAYEKLIPENSSPSYFLYLDVETDRVDVNVSPHKTEVRFADADDLYQIITSAIRSTLAKSGSIGMMDFDNKVAIDIPVLGGGATVYQEPKTSSGRAYNPFEAGYADGAADPNMTVDMSMYDVPYFDDGGKVGEQITSVPSSKATAVRGLKDVSWTQMPFNNEFALGAEPVELEDEEQYEEFSSSLITGEDDESSLEFVPSSIGLQQSFEEPSALEFGDVYSPGNGYAFATSGGRMMVVDLRRAKERILYDGYIAALSCGAASSQQLLFPEELTLSLSDYSLLEEFAEEFAALGFDLQLQGEGRVQVCGVPSSIVGQSADCLLYELLREAEQRGNMAEKMREDMARVMAVSGSRNIGHNITGEAATQLLQQLCECENYSFTPSGKAIMAELTAEELRTKLS